MSQQVQISFSDEHKILERLCGMIKSDPISLDDPIAEEQAYIQTLLYRCCDLGYGSFWALKENFLLTALSASRSLVETIIHAVCYQKELIECLEKKNLTGFNQLRAKYILGQKHKPKDETVKTLGKISSEILPDQIKTETKNIMTELKKCHKYGYKNLVNTYELLSEHVHPNALGSYLFFSRVDKESNRIILEQNLCKNEVIEYVKKTIQYLTIFEEVFDDIDQNLLPRFRELLNSQNESKQPKKEEK